MKPTTGSKLTFRWSYITLPLVVLFISIALTAYFYRLLPVEVAYRFRAGSPVSWLEREAVVLWSLATQLFLTMLALGITWELTRISHLLKLPENARGGLGGIVSLMGNMIVLPQIILAFAMLDIFRYNAYQKHILPLWGFAVAVMVAGGIILGIFFIRAIRQIRTRQKE